MQKEELPSMQNPPANSTTCSLSGGAAAQQDLGMRSWHVPARNRVVT